MDKFEIEFVKHNTYKFFINKKIYEKLAVLNTAYKFSDKAYFKIDSIDDENVAIFIKFKTDSNDIDAQCFVDDFRNELIDQQIRLDLEIRTGYIKNLIYEKAFSAVR